MSAARTHAFRTQGEEQTVELGRRLAQLLRPGDIVTLTGELGTGKTRLARGIAEGLGVGADRISSPTFVLVTRHEMNATPGQRPTALVHVDAYRLRGPEDLPLLGWDRLLDGRSIVVIEWADRLGAEAFAGAQLIAIRIEHVGPESRKIEVTMPEGRVAHGLDAAGSARSVSSHGARPCPICRAPVDPQSALAPFCSDRCRLVDLGKWLGGQYRISRPASATDIDQEFERRGKQSETEK